MISPKDGWNIEYGCPGVDHESLVIEFEDKQANICWYKEYFSGKSHGIFLGGTDDNPVLVVYEKISTEKPPPFKVLIMTKQGDERMLISEVMTKKQIPKAIKLESYNLVSVESTELEQELVQWEERSNSKNYKFGILYCKSGQKGEQEIFGNQDHDESAEFSSLLDCLGDKVRLKKWTKFSGGLNTEEDLDGKYSLFATYKDYSIMFHVATYLTHVSGDPQQLEKKRHIGNDIVVIVFIEEGAVLDPTFTKTQFNHVFIVVQPIKPAKKHQPVKYRIAVAGKHGVKPFGPKIPEVCQFEKGSQLKDFLLTKLINAERAALYAPGFCDRLALGRRLFLAGLRSHIEK